MFTNLNVNREVKYEERRIICSLYKSQKVVVKIEEKEIETDIKKEIGQECCLSSILVK